MILLEHNAAGTNTKIKWNAAEILTNKTLPGLNKDQFSLTTPCCQPFHLQLVYAHHQIKKNRVDPNQPTPGHKLGISERHDSTPD